MRTIRLSDLVQQGRQAKTAEAERDAVVPIRAVKPVVAEPEPEPEPEPAIAAPAAGPEIATDVADKIEVLAFQLLSISKTTKTNPRAVLVEALTSIDRCISSLAPRA